MKVHESLNTPNNFCFISLFFIWESFLVQYSFYDLDIASTSGINRITLTRIFFNKQFKTIPTFSESNPFMYFNHYFTENWKKILKSNNLCDSVAEYCMFGRFFKFPVWHSLASFLYVLKFLYIKAYHTMTLRG